MKISLFGLLASVTLAVALPAHAEVKTIVLVHGAFADGSGWKAIADILQPRGYTVRVVQEPLTAFEADVAAVRRALQKAGPCVLVGHSYAGMLITEAGLHPSVKALVYVAAFLPDAGESAGALQSKTPPAGNSVEPVGDGFLQINLDAFPNDFAADVAKPVARFMAISQAPIAESTFGAKVTVAAWKERPSYAVIPKQDRLINPELHRFMTKRAGAQTIELQGSHAIFLSQPKEVAALIEKAARASK
jgi:pimeloyl-ACP methyl ester carboxylesterase